MTSQIEFPDVVAATPQYASDEVGSPILVTVAKSTLNYHDGVLNLLEEQPPINLIGQHQSSPESSHIYESESAFTKLTTDCVLVGHACPKSNDQRLIDVSFTAGTLKQSLRVFGNRRWVKRLGIVDMTNPEPIEEPIPLIYERAFGGWDSAEPDPYTSQFEPRNPVGVGFKRKVFEEGLPLPNLEDPKHLIKKYGDTPPPAGFGFISPHWQPRASFAGTYDDKWEKERAPLLPTDFDLRFFNAASPGLIAPEYLKGDEQVVIDGVSPTGTIAFKLPGIQPPKIRVQLRGRKDAQLETNLDTVIINTDENLLIMLWRTHLVLQNGPHDVVAIEVTADVPDHLKP